MYLVFSLGSKVKRDNTNEKPSTVNNIRKLDETYLKESRVKVLKLFDSIFSLEKVPLTSFLEFLQLHVSEKCALIVQEYTLQYLAVSLSSSDPIPRNPDFLVDVEKINALYGRPIPRSFLDILSTLHFIIQNAPEPITSPAFISDGLLQSLAISDVSSYCYIDRVSSTTFLRRYLLSSSVKQSTVGRILRLSQVFTFNDPKDDEKDGFVRSADVLSGNERVRHIETIVFETEAIISNLKEQFDLFNGNDDSVISNVIMSKSSDWPLSNCVHTCIIAIENIQEKLKMVDLALNVTSSIPESKDAKVRK